MTVITESSLSSAFGHKIQSCFLGADAVYTVRVPLQYLIGVLQKLQSAASFDFNQLMDITAVDYSTYGQVDWSTQSTTFTGYSRAKSPQVVPTQMKDNLPSRFSVIYNLLSLTHHTRLRVEVFVDDEQQRVPSVVGLWPSANWPEREVFDLFGIVFDGHPDLRRILTDYGFKGHPFRKDFPLIGEVEMRYDAKQGRCVYEPVSITPRVNMPRVIRNDNRYAAGLSDTTEGDTHD